MSKACKGCHFVSEENACPLCGQATSKNWSGILTIIDPTQSELA